MVSYASTEDKIMTRPVVSVVIPTLHRSHLLMRALNSVLRQTHPVAEIIVVIDGPDDETVQMLGKIEDQRLLVIQNPRSMMAAGARNIGASKATGDWIAFLDDDDEWLPNKIERQVTFAEERDYRFVSCLSHVMTP